MNDFKRGSIWIIKSQNEVRNKSLPFGSRPVIIISNDMFNETHCSVSYIETFSGWKNTSDTRLKLSIKPGTEIYAETDKILSVNKEFLYCYQGQLDNSQLTLLTKKLAENFEIFAVSDKMNEIGNRILKSKEYSKNIEQIKKINRTTSDLSPEEKMYIVINYCKPKRDSMAEELNIYPYERLTNIANYLRNKYKTKGYV